MYVDLTDTASLSRDIIGWSENQTRSQMLDKYNIVTGFEMDDQVIYLTFNLGYEHVRGNTEKLLEILSLRDIKATFFLVGEFIEVFPEKVQAIYEDGHTLGAHSYYHIPPSYTMTDEEYINDLISTEKLLQTALGDDYTRMKYYRPIAGEYCERDLYIATTLGYTTVLFDATYSDWNRTVVNGMDYALTELKADVHNGAVYQLHIVTSDNIEALPAFLDDLISQGYTFKAF
jgi:peptidoglycan-N-acetylmuramic acid deacetylase